MLINQYREKIEPCSSVDELEDGTVEKDGETMISEYLTRRRNPKRKACKKAVPAWCKKQRRSRASTTTKTNKLRLKNSNQKKTYYTSRWTTERYKLGEESMFKIMKDEGAVMGKPIKRAKLRLMARNYIGDTGLLDHLLKHMDGMVAPCGDERFRRRHNFEGNMEYWLEDANLVDIRRESGIDDPYWTPPPGWIPGNNPSQDLIFSIELQLLKEEMAEIKRDFQKLVSTKQDDDQVTPSSSVTNQKEIPDDLMRWKSKIDQELMMISSSLSDMQENFEGLEKWKANIEQKLREISNSMNSIQVSNQYNSFSSSASNCWKDWFGNADLIDIPEDYPTWLEGGDLIEFKQENLPPWLDTPIKLEPTVRSPDCAPSPVWEPRDMSSQHSICGQDLHLFKQEMNKMKRDIQEFIPKKLEDSETKVTSESSVATKYSELDPDNSLLILQEMYKEVVNWKCQIEKQVMEMSKTLSSLQA